MKTDGFTIALLVMIALLLAIIALKPFPGVGNVTAGQPGSLDYLQVWNMSAYFSGGAFLVFDTRTGDLWAYTLNAVEGRSNPQYIGTLTDPGKPFFDRTRK
jgi:hypothetical protein